MTIERIQIPYEILVRFSTGQAHETASPGDFNGAHYEVLEIVRDTETGEVFSKRPVVTAMDRDALSNLFGTEFARFEAGFSALKEERDSLKKDLDLAKAARQ